MVIGNLGALRQKNFNRFMAYSSVAQAGFLLMACWATTTAREIAVPAIAFYLMIYSLSNYLAFFVYNILTGVARSSNFDALRGLSKQSPALALCLMIAMFSLAGIPPLGGFIGKFQLFLGAADGHFYWLILFAAINAMVSALLLPQRGARGLHRGEPEGTPKPFDGQLPAAHGLLVLVSRS